MCMGNTIRILFMILYSWGHILGMCSKSVKGYKHVWVSAVSAVTGQQSLSDVQATYMYKSV